MHGPVTKIAPQVIAVWSARAALALVATFVLGWVLRKLGAFVAWAADTIDSRLEKLEGGLVHKAAIFSRASVLRLAETVLGVVRWAASLIAIYLWIIACAFALDKTGRVADAIVNPFISALERIGDAAVGFLPNLVVMAAIALVARFVTHVVTLLSRAIEEHRVELPWLPADLAVPTRRIVNILVWLVALVVGNILLVPHFGLMGAALAALVAITLWSGAQWYTVLRITGVDVSIRARLSRPRPSVPAPAAE